jgi:hypothetical protein
MGGVFTFEKGACSTEITTAYCFTRHYGKLLQMHNLAAGTESFRFDASSLANWVCYDMVFKTTDDQTFIFTAFCRGRSYSYNELLAPVNRDEGKRTCYK